MCKTMNFSYQILIHISGTPGSGKTFFGAELAKIYPNAIVKDTDDFAQDLSHEDGRLFLNQMNIQIQKFIHDNPDVTIIFVGILDIIISGVTFLLDMKRWTPHLFYLDIPPAQLLRQFYTRIIDIGKMEPIIWEELAQNKSSWTIPSVREKLYEANASKEKHRNAGYNIATKTEIEDFLSQIICRTCNIKAQVKCELCSAVFCSSSCSIVHHYATTSCGI
jgi:hypothetical protein